MFSVIFHLFRRPLLILRFLRVGFRFFGRFTYSLPHGNSSLCQLNLLMECSLKNATTRCLMITIQKVSHANISLAGVSGVKKRWADRAWHEDKKYIHDFPMHWSCSAWIEIFWHWYTIEAIFPEGLKKWDLFQRIFATLWRSLDKYLISQ